VSGLTEDASSRLLGRPAYGSSWMDGTITGSSENHVLIAADMKSRFALGIVETLDLGSEDESYGNTISIGEGDDASLPA
jgi:hypothetical protein